MMTISLDHMGWLIASAVLIGTGSGMVFWAPMASYWKTSWRPTRSSDELAVYQFPRQFCAGIGAMSLTAGLSLIPWGSIWAAAAVVPGVLISLGCLIYCRQRDQRLRPGRL
jgi:hypothetical protein